MKKLFLFSVISCGASLLLSSCSRLENVSVSKRHYRSGYYVDMSSHKQDVSATKTHVRITTVPSKPAVAVAENNSNLLPEQLVPLPQPSTLSLDRRKHTPMKEGVVYASAQNNSITVEEIQAAPLRNYISSLPDPSSAAGGSSGNVPQWLMIVFCIILPPLAVGLKFGIVDKFWISVLLTLLFWLPGVIYALVLILD